MEINVTKLMPVFYAQGDQGANVIAHYSAMVGEFKIRKSTLRRRADGTFAVSSGSPVNRSQSHIVLPDGPTREALLQAVLAKYQEVVRANV